LAALCPDCQSTGSVVTSVTVQTLGTNPRTVLVTRLCQADGCHLKYNEFKSEHELSEDERQRWHSP
jgi:hypothetical protein